MTAALVDQHRERIVTAVREAVPGLGEPVLFLAGSMVDGLANDGSDLDVYLVAEAGVTGAATTTRRREKNGTIGFLESREINLSILDPTGLAELATSFGACLASMAGDGGIAQLDSENDLKVLHRVRTGQPLRGGPGLRRLGADLGCDRLDAYLANLHGVTALNRARDVQGELSAGREESAGWMLREALVHTGQLALALGGETNPSRKWLVRLLRRPGAHQEVRDWAADRLVTAAPDLPADLTRLTTQLRTLVEGARDGVVGPYLRRIVGPPS
ncbi:nucleotidyltransferase domain-containing protein [Micromonospora matsumotoense]|uniref:nucleotidyltransferase domain-containing protein n=1 Tax=Micromonospora matsumotoense TaxID=121616 RepID=UPI0033CD593E